MDNWVTGLLVYVIVWWLVFFMVLPWGIRPMETEDVEKGHAPSAPQKPRILLKMAVTTVIAAVFWYGGYLVDQSGIISFRPN